MHFMAKYSFTSVAVCALGVVLTLATSHGFARAQSLDPFEADSGSWKSFDRYKEEEKERIFSTMTGNIDADAKAAKAGDKDKTDSEERATLSPLLAPEAKADQVTPPALKEPVMAQPDRPIDPPLMPGINKGFDVRVGTTEDDVKPGARLADIDTTPTLQLPKQNWLDAAQAAKEQASGKGDFQQNVPFDVRMSFLPGLSAPHKHASPHAPVVASAPPIVEPPKSAADAAACAAIDAYKKKQLAAIQSDRATLTALQTAISQLGLQKELGFIATTGSKVDVPADKTVLMDMPPSALSALPPVSKP
jgi:hypothetical protein